MRLTDKDGARASLGIDRTLPSTWAVGAVVAGLLAVFILDGQTGAEPLQHLYYLPIVLASLQFGSWGAWPASIAAVVLYHLANPALLAFAHEERDVVQIILFVGVGVVTAKLRDDARRLKALAGTDDLTGLLNLRAFEQRLSRAVRGSRLSHAPLSLLVIDLDGLKALNDVHGHLAGAEAVQTVGRLIAAHLPPGAFACRYGGDEFVVALPGLEGPAERTPSAILAAVRSTAPVLAGTRFPASTLSVSIGMAHLDGSSTDQRNGAVPEDDRAGEALFRRADAALYEAKRGGRGRICVV